MTYNLYLDDERTPKTSKNWVIVRDYNDAVWHVLEDGFPDFISFDHDLGEGKSGYDFAHWLVNHDIENNVMPNNFMFNVHSANPVGRDNIEGLLNNYITVKKVRANL